jgi:hypothetical protein
MLAFNYDETVAKMGNGFRTAARRDQSQDALQSLCGVTREGFVLESPSNVFELHLYLDASGSWKLTPAS